MPRQLCTDTDSVQRALCVVSLGCLLCLSQVSHSPELACVQTTGFRGPEGIYSLLSCLPVHDEAAEAKALWDQVVWLPLGSHLSFCFLFRIWVVGCQREARDVARELKPTRS